MARSSSASENPSSGWRLACGVGGRYPKALAVFQSTGGRVPSRSRTSAVAPGDDDDDDEREEEQEDNSVEEVNVVKLSDSKVDGEGRRDDWGSEDSCCCGGGGGGSDRRDNGDNSVVAVVVEGEGGGGGKRRGHGV